MSVSSSLSRSCAACCKQFRAHSKFPVYTQRAQSTRSISHSSSQSYALPTEETPISIDQTELHAQSYPTNHAGQMISSRPQDQFQRPPTYMYTGTVSRVGTMEQTVQITREHQVFDKFLQKHYTRPLRLKAHDPHPAGYLREGDIVEYGTYTQAEKDMKVAKDKVRIAKEEERLRHQDKTGKALRKFQRTEAKKAELQGTRVRGVQYMVRRVVTPFGTALEERMEKLATQPSGQEPAKDGGQDSPLRGRGGNMSQQKASATMAG